MLLQTALKLQLWIPLSHSSMSEIIFINKRNLVRILCVFMIKTFSRIYLRCNQERRLLEGNDGIYLAASPKLVSNPGQEKPFSLSVRTLTYTVFLFFFLYFNE